MEEQFLYPKSTKVSVWCEIMLEKIIEPLSNQKSIMAQIYFDESTKYVVPQLEEHQPSVIFQQDGALPH